MIEVSAIEQEHVSQRPPILVLAVGLKDNISPEDQRGRSLLRSVAEGLALLRAVDATEADTFRWVLCSTSIVSPSRTEMTGP